LFQIVSGQLCIFLSICHSLLPIVITQKAHEQNLACGQILLFASPFLDCVASLFLELHDAKVKTVQDLRSTADVIGTNEAAAPTFQEIQISSLAEDKVPALISGMTRCTVT
jgi:hypothetical protein